MASLARCLVVGKRAHLTIMPYINIQITREGVTSAQKKELIAGATKLLVDVLAKNPKTTHVVIQEIETDNWGVDGQQFTELLQKR